jgi:hypothetical protein
VREIFERGGKEVDERAGLELTVREIAEEEAEML